MNASYIWLCIGALTLATFLTRCLLFLLGDAVKMPSRVQHALRYAPAAALAAIIMPDLVLSGAAIDVGWTNPKLMAALGATLFFLATRNSLGTIIAGMLLYTGLRLAL